ncbi:MAG: hypothetical protein RJQ10_07445 [Haliea sp.]|uniref:hypothetical protein n=1 Tax=Haliea sp. TaxID=1932666 RepID=UPI0032EB59AB
MSTVRELHKLACLDALGLQLLVARKPLPGAAPSVPGARMTRATVVPDPRPPATPQPAGGPGAGPIGRAPAMAVPRLDAGGESPVPAVTSRAQVADAAAAPATTPVLHMAAVVAGGCLWLDPLPGSEPAPDRLQLIRAMAFALVRRQETPQLTRFDWPVHSNRQLDLSASAAAAALTGFVLRQVQDRECRALVLLGPDAGEHLLQPELDGVPIVLLPATMELLAKPQSKRDAWRALAALGR